MGTLHLEIKRHRMERDFRLKIRVGKPRVSYRETIREAITTQGECQRVVAGSQLFALMTVAFEPIPLEEYLAKPEAPAEEVAAKSKGKGKGKDKGAVAVSTGPELVRVKNKLKHDELPENLAKAAIDGLKSALQSGEIGYPVMGVQATLLSAKFDPAASNEVAFTAAAADAVHKALKDNIALLEPVMRLEVVVPEEFLGPITGDLNARRAEIRDILVRGKTRAVDAIVPLARLFDYADKIRSLSQGRASSTMEPYAYGPAPEEVLRQILNPEY
jgi:elongation factor G